MYKERVDTCAIRISKALSIRKMKQIELCELTNIPRSSLSLYLSGAYEPKQDRIYSMAKALNVSEAWLMGYDVPMQREKTSPEEPRFSESEVRLILAYRSKPEMQHSVNVLLGIQDGADIVEDMVQTIKGTKKIQI